MIYASNMVLSNFEPTAQNSWLSFTDFNNSFILCYSAFHILQYQAIADFESPFAPMDVQPRNVFVWLSYAGQLFNHSSWATPF